MLKLAILACFIGVTTATTGFDATLPMSVSAFNCMKSNGYEFFIARVWHSTGQYDSTGAQNIKNARSAGWANVDGYIFPCPKSSCPSPEDQIKTAVNNLKSAGAKYGMLWLDIEIYNWSSNINTNRDFINRMANQLNAMGVKWGIYTNNNNWENIVGSSWSQWSGQQLWWAAYNGHQDFTNFVPFGGWSKPNIHQYQGDYSKGPCGVTDMDLNCSLSVSPLITEDESCVAFGSLGYNNTVIRDVENINPSLKIWSPGIIMY